jgi:hypothetical protein
MNESEKNGNRSYTDSSDAILFICEGPGNTTRRPRPPDLPRYLPGQIPPDEEPPTEEEPPGNPPEKS